MKIAKLVLRQHTTKNDVFSYFTNQQVHKPTMLLLHGFSADKTIWLKFAKHATKDYNLIIPDLKGHGDIPYSNKDNYSAFAQADYVRRFMHALGVKGPITIVGNSMGGMISAILATENKNHIDKKSHSNHENSQIKSDEYFQSAVIIDNLVLIDPAGAKSDFALQTRASASNPFNHQTMQDSFDFYKLIMHKPPFIPPSALAYISQTNYLDKRQQNQHMFHDFFNPEEFFEQPLHSSARRITLIWGEQDKMIPATDASNWEKLLPCETHILPNIGHMPMVECPEATYLLIKSN